MKMLSRCRVSPSSWVNWRENFSKIDLLFLSLEFRADVEREGNEAIVF